MDWILRVLVDSVGVTVLLGAAAWLSREWITARLRAAVELETGKELEAFKKRLEAAESEVAVVRHAGIEAARASNAALFAERVNAVKALWQGVNAFGGGASVVSTIVAAMTLAWVDRSADDRGTKDTMRQLLDAIKYQELMAQANGLTAHRPFVSERAWALFAAYRGFYAARISKAAFIYFGGAEAARRLWLLDTERRLINELCPRHLDTYDRNPVEVEGEFITYVANELLAELQRGLSGEQSGPDAVRQAAAISAITQQAMREAQKAEHPIPAGLNLPGAEPRRR